MATNDFRDFLSEVTPHLVPPPIDAPDVCPVCRSWKLFETPECSNCRQAFDELRNPCSTIIPISLYRKPSTLRDWLKYYKADGEEARPEYATYIAAVFANYVETNLSTLHRLSGGWDEVVVVPSSSRLPPHPLESIVRTVFGPEVLASPLKRTGVPLGHRVMSDQAYVASGDVEGKRYLLVDDVFTTGARCQSAASVLRTAGAQVGAVLVAGRRIDPDFNEIVGALWARQSSQAFDFKNVSDYSGSFIAMKRHSDGEP